MKKISIAIFAFMLFAGVLSAQESREYTKQYGVYSEEWAKEVVSFMADEKFNGREAGTKENHKIMKFIAKEFKKMGLKPEIQEITSESLTAAIGEPRKGKVYPAKMNNVIARIEGKNPNMQVVVGAHYDHLGNKPGIGIHPGADDNASGIVALLSLAKMMKASGITPEYTVVFCAWDGEEKGLLGSKYFVAGWYANRTAADSICRYMNFDMVGRCDDPSKPATTFAWNDNYPSLKQDCISVYETIEQPFTVIYDRRLGDGKGGSDYAPFSKHNVPFVAWMEEELHEDYHKPGDVPSKICWERLHKTVLLAYGILYSWVD